MGNNIILYLILDGFRKEQPGTGKVVLTIFRINNIALLRIGYVVLVLKNINQDRVIIEPSNRPLGLRCSEFRVPRFDLRDYPAPFIISKCKLAITVVGKEKIIKLTKYDNSAQFSYSRTHNSLLIII
jgi:hypothetical protein